MFNKYNIFGSPSSVDTDILVYINDLLSIEENKQLCKMYEQHFSSIYNKPNVNIGVLENGSLKDVFKGTKDECNNSIFYTHKYHNQKHPCVITKLYIRDIDLKIERATRIILSFLSRTEYRKIVKKALLSNSLEERLMCLEQIDFNKLTSFDNKKIEWEDGLKTISFQIGQVLGLIEGKELYTKEDISDVYPFLKDFLFRCGGNISTYVETYIEKVNIFKNVLR